MKIQLALDRLSKDECIDILEETIEYVDIIEIGTGIIKEYGMKIVKDIRRLYPETTLLADMKTCDAGKHETKQALESGADITTVMAFSADQTIIDSLEVAKSMGKKIMIDLLGITSREKIEKLKELGVELVDIHLGKDSQKETKFSSDMFSLVKGLDLEIAVAGGINLDTLPDIVKENPDIVIVGSAITKAKNKKETIKKLKDIMNENKY